MLEDVSDPLQMQLQRLYDRQQLLLLDCQDAGDGLRWDTNLVSRVCATIGGLMEHLSLEHTPSDQPLRTPIIRDGSLHIEGAGVVIPPDEVGAFMAPTVGLSGEQATLAWRTVAPMLPNHPGVLPNVEPFGYRPSWDYHR